jgi:hypothetical protein
MKLTFGNMTVDLNIFYFGKQPSDLMDEPFNCNLIQGLSSEHWEDEELELMYDDQFIDIEEMEELFDSMEEENQADVSSTYCEPQPELLTTELRTPLKLSIK